MATARIDRSDDTAAVLKIVATVSDTEDAVTKQWQGVVVSDGTSPAANKLAVSVGGAASVTVATALPAGSAAIGKLAANSGVDIGDVDVTSVPAPLSTTGSGTEATALRVTLATDSTGLVSVDDNGGALTVDGTVTAVGAAAHSAAISGNPVRIGATAIAFGTNPTEVSAAEATDLYTNLAGVQLVTGPHMNPITIEFTQAAADGAQANVALITVAGGAKICVTQVQVLADQANTVETSVRIGFAAATLGAASTTPVVGIVASHPGIVPGSGISRGDGMGILGVGADGEDLRITISSPTGGNNVVLVSYFTVTA